MNIEQKALTSVEVAEMVGKDHAITNCNAQVRMEGDLSGV